MTKEDFIREKEMAQVAKEAELSVNQTQTAFTNKRPSRLQQLKDEQKHLLKRLHITTCMIEYLEQREYVQEALDEFDKFDSLGW